MVCPNIDTWDCHAFSVFRPSHWRLSFQSASISPVYSYGFVRNSDIPGHWLNIIYHHHPYVFNGLEWGVYSIFFRDTTLIWVVWAGEHDPG